MIYYEDTQLIIRSMKENDIYELKKEYDEQQWPKDIKILQDYFNQQESYRKYIVVAEFNKKAAGYVTLLPQAEYGPFINKNIPELVDLIVFEKYQRNGIGSRILDAAEDVASGISDTISLSVGVHSGYGQAQRLYIKRGYIPDGSGVWYHNRQLEQYADCKNDDDLLLFLSKKLK
ncbi:MAG: GCN5-related N-acetyltransferase [Eubacterium sp.]|nr:GCN5-related N-acetyltransferase [Eubacterium sp.]